MAYVLNRHDRFNGDLIPFAIFITISCTYCLSRGRLAVVNADPQVVTAENDAVLRVIV